MMINFLCEKFGYKSYNNTEIMIRICQVIDSNSKNVIDNIDFLKFVHNICYKCCVDQEVLDDVHSVRKR